MLQLVINGVLLGGLYAVVAMGFTIQYGVMNILNVAHGGFIMLGAYVTYWAFHLLGIDPFLGAFLAGAVLYGVGYLTQRFLIEHVAAASIFMIMLLTFGLDMLITNGALLAWSADYRTINPSYAGTRFDIGGSVVPTTRLGVLVVACGLTAALYFYINKTNTGLAIQAVALNKYAAELVGLDLNRVYRLAFSLGSALAGVAGGLLAAVYAFSPLLGGVWLTKAFVITVLGGLGNMTGAILGALFLGLSEVIGAEIMGPSYSTLVGFVLMVAILVLRPQGLVGKRFFAEVRV